MKEYIEQRAMEIARYIIDNNATVRQAAKQFGVSKSTVHTVATKQNGLCGELNREERMGYNIMNVATCFSFTDSLCLDNMIKYMK